MVETLCTKSREEVEKIKRIIEEVSVALFSHSEMFSAEEIKRMIEEVKSFFGIKDEGIWDDAGDNCSPDFRDSSAMLINSKNVEELKPFPPRYMIEAAFLRALKPKKILFACLHNSARSIIAEGIAKHLAPSHVEVLSAGSDPLGVKEEAKKVLNEMGIDTKGLYSKSLKDIDLEGVDVIITLCEEEKCPVVPGKAIKLHWSLPDPSSEMDPHRRIEAFRKTRNELIKRISLIFGEKKGM